MLGVADCQAGLQKVEAALGALAPLLELPSAARSELFHRSLLLRRIEYLAQQASTGAPLAHELQQLAGAAPLDDPGRTF